MRTDKERTDLIKATRKEMLLKFKEILEVIDLDLLLTDVKDTEGNKISESDEIMKLFFIFADVYRKEIEKELELIKKRRVLKNECN